jgi:hypothetical protein
VSVQVLVEGHVDSRVEGHERGPGDEDVEDEEDEHRDAVEAVVVGVQDVEAEDDERKEGRGEHPEDSNAIDRRAVPEHHPAKDLDHDDRELLEACGGGGEHARERRAG